MWCHRANSIPIFVVLAHLEDHEATFCGRQEARTPPNTSGDGNEGIGWDGRPIALLDREPFHVFSYGKFEALHNGPTFLTENVPLLRLDGSSRLSLPPNCSQPPILLLDGDRVPFYSTASSHTPQHRFLFRKNMFSYTFWPSSTNFNIS